VDLHLPRLNGLEVIRVLRAMPSLEQTPIIIITGNTTAEYIKEAAQLGVSDFLVKANFLSGASLDRIRRFLDTPPAAPSTTTRQDGRLKVLVVDDHEDVRAQLVARLASLNTRVLLACDGLQGVAVAASESPALLLVDLDLPRMNGLELIRVVRDLQQGSGPEILIVTGKATKEALKAAKELGVSAVLTKSEMAGPDFDARLKAAVAAAARRHPPARRRGVPVR
jgi:CheY-like chemotaxis protein